jgi:pyruvate dehydrogenase E1 component beta subunit
MFGGASKVPITIRLIVGHGWGQGPTHSQNLQSLFSQIPGLKVVIPTTAYDAKGLLLESIFDNDPVIFLEHRWLYGLESNVPESSYRIPIGKANLVNEGSDLTIVSLSYMTIESIQAVKELEKIGIHCDLIDLRTTSPLDFDLVRKSVKKTGKLIAVDSSVKNFSVASEVIADCAIEVHKYLQKSPRRVALDNAPSPTSFGLTESYYNGALEIYNEAINLMGIKEKNTQNKFLKEKPHDVPGEWFKGPF